MLAGIWQELLGIERVGRDDHFFELGGHSLLVVTLVERLRQCGMALTMRSVFQSPVLWQLASTVVFGEDVETFSVPANRITRDTVHITPDLLPLVALSQSEIDRVLAAVPGGAANVQDIYPLSPLQEGILFHHLLADQADAYQLRTLLAFDARSELDAFAVAFAQVIARHDILRSAVHWEGLGRPVQAVWRNAKLPLVEMAAQAGSDAVERLRAVSHPLHFKLDVRQAPMIHGHVAQQGERGEWLLMLSYHHMVSDHITLALIVEEVQAILAGRVAELPTPIPYRNFIAQVNAIPPAEHEQYFRRVLGGLESPTAPFGILDTLGDGSDVTETSLALDAELDAAIRACARDFKVTPAALFHLAYAKVLASFSGNDDVVFGTVLSGRLQGGAEAGRILGMFVNTLPLRVSLGQSLQSAVEQVQAALHELIEHEQASLAMAQRCSDIAAPLPLFTTILNYRHNDVAEISPELAAGLVANWHGMRMLGGEERTNYPISLSVEDNADSFALTEQCTARIEPGCIARAMLTTLQNMVDALRHEPAMPLTGIRSMPQAEYVMVTRT
ncbi:condensation domain-containing protein, partial [Massilia sp. BJB1822]|uniref:condensation domain-containing protein n=1 Tax=Massilia sp. BJB1822 TaxID=2744470 RepID=UPI0018001F1B|nr:non-ribosomal peptide synthetase [Massilia sp. BJB1822]